MTSQKKTIFCLLVIKIVCICGNELKFKLNNSENRVLLPTGYIYKQIGSDSSQLIYLNKGDIKSNNDQSAQPLQQQQSDVRASQLFLQHPTHDPTVDVPEAAVFSVPNNNNDNINNFNNNFNDKFNNVNTINNNNNNNIKYNNFNQKNNVNSKESKQQVINHFVDAATNYFYEQQNYNPYLNQVHHNVNQQQANLPQANVPTQVNLPTRSNYSPQVNLPTRARAPTRASAPTQVNFPKRTNLSPQVNLQSQASLQPQANLPTRSNFSPQVNFQPQLNLPLKANTQPQLLWNPI